MNFNSLIFNYKKILVVRQGRKSPESHSERWHGVCGISANITKLESDF